jgi:hypothetical protein
MHHQLERDLGLDGTDRDMIALWLEEMEDIELPTSQFQTVRTVGQLVRLLRACKREGEQDERALRTQRMNRLVGVLTRARQRPQPRPRVRRCAAPRRAEISRNTPDVNAAALARHG